MVPSVLHSRVPAAVVRRCRSARELEAWASWKRTVVPDSEALTEGKVRSSNLSSPSGQERGRAGRPEERPRWVALAFRFNVRRCHHERAMRQILWSREGANHFEPSTGRTNSGAAGET